MQSVKAPTSRDYQEHLINSLQDPERAAGYIAAILEEENPEPELLPAALDDVALALGDESDRQWVKDFGTNNKSLAVYELGAWLDSLGLKLTVTVKP
ncbi:transcriptional regulator [Tumidithrix elongata RA019]|uniref:Transcriptional regulator n=1 Tax=Tumidithrix elongata BACA0141 TaxID=2716417 RepID=A0AAW9PUZ3_9CYAN|nr:transcriptional regulator [Tumidithrix elongata RA019]